MAATAVHAYSPVPGSALGVFVAGGGTWSPALPLGPVPVLLPPE